MTKKEQKIKAQDLIMNHIANIGYGSDYEEFSNLFGSQEEADAVMKTQMDRIAKMFGFGQAWFY